MANHSSYMLSGLERELELYMGQEYESGSRSLPVRNTEGDDVNITLQIDESAKTGSITVSAYTKKDGTPVSASTVILREIRKVDDKTVIGTADQIEGHKNVPLKMHVDDSASSPKLIATPGKYALGQFVALPVKPRTYLLIGPDAQSNASNLAGFIKSLKLEKELELEVYDDEYALDPDEDSAGRMEYFLPIFGKKEDSTAELLKVLRTTDQATRDAFVGELKKIIQDWLNKSGPLSVARVALLNAQRFVGLTARYGRSPDRFVEQVGYALEALRSLKDIAIMEGIINVAMILKDPPAGVLGALIKVGSVASRTGRTLTNVASIKKTLKEVESLLQEAEAKRDTAEILYRLKEARTKIQSIESAALYELNGSNELEYEEDDYELDDEFENEFEFEDGDEPEDEFEYEYELENELEDNGVTEYFARRLYELSIQSFESEYELDAELKRALDAMENEFMVKRLQRKRRRGKRKGLFKKILNTGAKIVGKVAGQTPIGSLIKAGTSLVRGNVRAAVGNLAKAAVGVAAPGIGTAATAAMDALGGGEEGEISHRKRRAIKRVARITRDAYREVADTLPEDFDHPLVANEVARRAVHKAMVKNGVRPPGRTRSAPQQSRVIKLSPGEKVVIVRTG